MNKTKFNGVEVIGVRLFHQGHHHAVSRMFNELVSGIERCPGELVAASLYSSTSVETDWAIHLYRRSEKGASEKTGVGIHLAEALSSLGLIHHSVWCCKKSVSQ